jgi:hypothetical protein
MRRSKRARCFTDVSATDYVVVLAHLRYLPIISCFCEAGRTCQRLQLTIPSILA